MCRFHSFLDPKVLVHPAKEKAHGNGRVWFAATCFRSDDKSLKGPAAQNWHRLSCFEALCCCSDFLLFPFDGGVPNCPWNWVSSAPDSLGSSDEPLMSRR